MPSRAKVGTLPQHRARLHAALATLRRYPDRRTMPPPVAALARWTDTWKGLGAIIAAMTALGYDVELAQYPHGWWARFYLSSASRPVCAGSGWAVEPWHAVQAAAWQVLTGGNPEARLREQLGASRPERRSNPAGGPAGMLRTTR